MTIIVLLAKKAVIYVILKPLRVNANSLILYVSHIVLIIIMMMIEYVKNAVRDVGFVITMKFVLHVKIIGIDI